MSKKNYVLPRTRIDLYKMCFAFSGSFASNSPPKMKTYKSVRGFKVGLRKILIKKRNRAPGNLWLLKLCLLTFCACIFTVLVFVTGKRGKCE